MVKKSTLIFKMLIICVCILFLTSCDAGVGFYESNDISTYRNFGVPDDGGYARIYTFPENLDNVKVINNYYFVANFPPFGTTSWVGDIS
ncbi:MAG: hypothetical protein M0Q88_07395 [Bacilli bacterium]|nr:hypothetical protein [Bacilli bacterium]